MYFYLHKSFYEYFISLGIMEDIKFMVKENFSYNI